MSVQKPRVYTLSLIFILLFFPISTIYAGTVPRFTIMTEEWEPYNFQKDGVVKGISTDILVLMLEKTGSSQGRNDIIIYPWVRAYKHTQENPGTILFTTTRTEKREKMFKWVGSIFEIEFNIYALKSRNIKINSPEDLKKYKIGTLRGDVTEDLLVKNAGLIKDNFYQVGLNLRNTKKLSAGRIDLIAQSNDTTIATCREAGIDPNTFEAVLMLDKKSMYYAFHKDTPDSLITIFQMAFDDIKNSGKLTEIFQNYGK